MNIRKITDEAVKCFIDYLNENERSSITVEKYNRDIKAFRRFIGDGEIIKETVIGYKQQLLSNGYAERSVNSMIASVNSFFRFLGWFDCRVKAIKLSPEIFRPDEKELTRCEYEKLVHTAIKNGNERLAVILQTICGTGIRVSELRFVTVEAVKRGEAHVHCKGKYRKVFIVKELKRIILAYAEKNHIGTGVVFRSRGGEPLNRTVIWRDMKKICAAARVNPSKVFPHNLRHLFARVFYKKEKDIAKLADILGHSSINTTRIYIISTGREHERKMEKMGLVHPIRV